MSPTASRIFRIRPERRILSARVLAALVVMVGDAALGAAWFDQASFDAAAGMSVAAAVCLVLMGISVILLPRRGGQRRRWRLRILPAAVAVIAALDLAVGYLAPGAEAARMSTLTGACLWLGSASLFCLTSQSRRWVRAVRGFAVTGLLTVYVAVLAFAFQPAALAGNFVYAGMSRPVALCLMALFVAICLVDPRPTWLDAVFGRGQGARTARRLAPVALAGPLLLAVAAAKSTEFGFLSTDLRLMLLTAALTFVAAETLKRTAQAGNIAQETLRARCRLMEQIVDGLPVAVAAFDRQGREVFANEAARQMTAGFDSPAAWLRETEFARPGAAGPVEEAERPLDRLLRGEILDCEPYVARRSNGCRMRLRISSSDRIYPYDAPYVLAVIADAPDPRVPPC